MKQTIQVPVTPELKEQLARQAQQQGLSLASYIRMIIIKAVCNVTQPA